MIIVFYVIDFVVFFGIVFLFVGFILWESVVLLFFYGSCIDGVMCFDFFDDDIDLDVYVDVVVGFMVCVLEIDVIVVVVYIDWEVYFMCDGFVFLYVVVVDEVLGCVEDVGFCIVDVLCVIFLGWVSFFEVELQLYVFEYICLFFFVVGDDVCGDQLVGVDFLEVDFVEKECVGRVVVEFVVVFDVSVIGCVSGCENLQFIVVFVLLEDILVFFEFVFVVFDDFLLFVMVVLLWCFDWLFLCDVVIVQWVIDFFGGV